MYLILAGVFLATGAFRWGTEIRWPWRKKVRALRTVAPAWLGRPGGKGVTIEMRDLYLAIVKRWHPDQATSTEDFMRRNHITALANKAWDAKDGSELEKLNALKKGD